VARFRHLGGVDADALSSDETRIEVRTNDGFGVWDIPAKRFLLRRSNATGDSFDVGALSPDGRIAIMGPLGSVWAWDVSSGRGKRLFSIGDAVEADLAAFSPDGSRLVAGASSPSRLGTTGGPVLWDVARGGRIATLNGHTSGISRVSFSPDGRRILTAAEDETARLWDGRTGAPLAVIGSHTGDVTSASFSPDGRFIATTSGDDAIRIADGSTGAPVAVARTGRGGVFAAAFVGRTTQLVATHAGGRPWLVRCRLCAPLDDLLALARRRITRDLTRAERAKYLHQ
jgi:WD40 repeat protein